MNVKIEKITEKAFDTFSKFIAQMTHKSKNNDLILDKPVGGDRSLLGMKITKVKFLGNEYFLKANRYMLLIVLNYLVQNNMIDLEEELPIKNSSTNKRFLINNKPFHADGYKMRDLLILKTETGCLYLEAKLNTPTIHNACFNLLSRYNIPMDSLEVQYSNRKNKVPEKYIKNLKQQGYCLVEDNSHSEDFKRAA